MRIGLISDTHGDVAAWEKAVDVFGEIDFAIHAGDILSSGPFNPRQASYKPLELARAINFAPFPTIFAKGNCDAEVDSVAIAYPIENNHAFIYIGGLRIMATHGHKYSEEKLVEMGRRYHLHIIVSGHTHIRNIRVKEGVLLVNPGSAALPKGNDDIATVGIIDDMTVKIISLEDGSEVERMDITLVKD